MHRTPREIAWEIVSDWFAEFPGQSAPNRALVVVVGRQPYVLEAEVSECLNDALSSSAALDSVDHRLEDGVWSVRVRWIDDGPGDYPGTREAVVQFYDAAPATSEEWRRFRDGEVIWT